MSGNFKLVREKLGEIVKGLGDALGDFGKEALRAGKLLVSALLIMAIFAGCAPETEAFVPDRVEEVEVLNIYGSDGKHDYYDFHLPNATHWRDMLSIIEKSNRVANIKFEIPDGEDPIAAIDRFSSMIEDITGIDEDLIAEMSCFGGNSDLKINEAAVGRAKAAMGLSSGQPIVCGFVEGKDGHLEMVVGTYGPKGNVVAIEPVSKEESSIGGR